MTDQNNPFPLPDFNEMLKHMQVPGVNVETLMQEGQKNIEAVQDANRAVAEGWQNLTHKQTEIFQETMQRWAEAMQAASNGADMAQQTAAAREGFERSLANMRELAQIAAESQTQAIDIMRRRFEENMRSMMPGNTSD